MAIQDGNYLTRQGTDLIAKLVGTEIVLQFTRVTVGKGSVPAGTEPEDMTDLADYVMDGQISSRAFRGEGEATLGVQLINSTVPQGFNVTELALWAQDPQLGEILYSYAVFAETPIWINANNATVARAAEVTLSTLIGGVRLVEAKINPASLVSQEDLIAYAAPIRHTHTIDDVTGLPLALQNLEQANAAQDQRLGDIESAVESGALVSKGMLAGMLREVARTTLTISAEDWEEGDDGFYRKTVPLEGASISRDRNAWVSVPEPWMGYVGLLGGTMAEGTISLCLDAMPGGSFSLDVFLYETYRGEV